MDPAEVKQEIRKRKKAWRRKLSPEERYQRSVAIFEKWRGRFSMKTTCYLHVYQPIDKLNEVDTGPIMDYVYERHPHVRPVVPVMNPMRNELEHVELTDEVYLAPNAWGIPEPVMPFRKVFPMILDMVLVPMLAFDMEGNRLGYGKGYYDRFLRLLRPGCLIVGLCYDEGKERNQLPIYETDVPMDFVVTEQRVYRFCDNSKTPGSV